MEIIRTRGCAVVYFGENELPGGLPSRGAPLRSLLKRAVKAAFLPPPARVEATALPARRGCALLLRPAREGRCVIALRFRDAGAASALIERLHKELDPTFTPHADGSLTLTAELSCADAERVAARAWDFCVVSYPSAARAAYLREWRSR